MIKGIFKTIWIYMLLSFNSWISQKPIEFILLEQNKYSGELNHNYLYFSAIYIVKNYSENRKSQMHIDRFAMELGKKTNQI